MSQQALCACGLYKFWCLGGLRAKPRLLQMLVDYWDLDLESFQIDGMSLTIELEDIYFITGISRRGEVVRLHSHGGLGGGLNINEYMRCTAIQAQRRWGVRSLPMLYRCWA